MQTWLSLAPPGAFAGVLRCRVDGFPPGCITYQVSQLVVMPSASAERVVTGGRRVSSSLRIASTGHITQFTHTIAIDWFW